jgi:hypothetical protein
MGQMVLKNMSVQVEREVNGLEMGVLSDGTAYLTGRALANLCGIRNSSISEASKDWLENAPGHRTTRLAVWLEQQGLARDSLYVLTEKPKVGGNVAYAYPDDVVTLVVEYYAYEAANTTPEAKRNHRILTRAGVRAFVYHQLGYDPAKAIPAAWRQFHDRLLLASAPVGFFSVFKETADFVLAAIRRGLEVDPHIVPDISMGQAWAAFWKDNDLAAKFGQRDHHEHNYPDYFPQAASNPQEIWVYPVHALGEFRLWLHREYIPNRFPKYLKGKVTAGVLPASTAELLLADSTSERKRLPGGG